MIASIGFPAALQGAVFADRPSSWTGEVRSGAKCHYADSVFGALKACDWTNLEEECK